MTEFSKKKKGLQPNCKPCASEETQKWYSENKDRARDTRLRKTYGVSLDFYEEMYQRQEGRCAICGNPFSGARYTERMACVDHDHSTGAVRGLLCNACNRGLGYFRDNEEYLKNAINYLKENENSLYDEWKT